MWSSRQSHRMDERCCQQTGSSRLGGRIVQCHLLSYLLSHRNNCHSGCSTATVTNRLVWLGKGVGMGGGRDKGMWGGKKNKVNYGRA